MISQANNIILLKLKKETLRVKLWTHCLQIFSTQFVNKKLIRVCTELKQETSVTVTQDSGKILKISFKIWGHRISVIFRLPRPCH